MYRILIADDEDIERRVLRRKLERNFGDSCEILEALNGREVLNLYREKAPHILILDIEMPGITGLEAAERIRQKDWNCSIIFLTAFDEFSYAKKAITVGALDYLLKPCAEKELLSVVEEGIRRADRAEAAAKASAAEESAASGKRGYSGSLPGSAH
ncbi:MAG: response regulator, partial [Lachnospiraceae bacterium]|nr:response regulator [Lachnospiraceae bacterium]